jgi:fructosamine-3-kinase
MIDSKIISAAIGQATGQVFQISHCAASSGGCINQTYQLRGQDGRQFFIKLNSANRLAMFAAEAAGLNEIAATQTIRVPQPVAHGIAGAQSFLVLEYLDLGGRSNDALLGKQLAALHRTQAAQFGWQQNNTIGDTPQQNAWSDNWITFWREQRLGFQLSLAEKNGYTGKLQQHGEKLLSKLPDFFVGHQPDPSLLHGDLWSGNHGYLASGEPVLFDPAPYYGDREADLAMTELFGGFGADFYAAYRAAYPLHAGYTPRRDLYNLYHILNHANLFGGGYVRQAEQMMEKLLAGIN